MTQQTPLYQCHVDMGAKIVDFAGWSMPIQYTSQIEEHHQVRSDAGMFDVSHMTVVDLHGERVRDFLSYVMANDIAKVTKRGKALYTAMLNEQGGVIDDLIIYYLEDHFFRLVVNAATRDKDLAWLEQQAAAFSVEVKERSDLAMIAVQGPKAIEKALQLIPEEFRESVLALSKFEACEVAELFVARTGYTGEDGLEIILPNESAPDFWKALDKVGVAPIGLGARDSLRLEAGMNLYGNDMDESTTPLVSALGWTVAMKDERDFIGRAALEQQKQAGVPQKLVGLVLEGRGVMRAHQKVFVDGDEVGELTSGGFSPTLKNSIGLARIARDSASLGDTVEIEIRNKRIAARIVKYPFVRDGQAQI
ncbi:glycine cleavage system T protein [gamma proteobacterium HTCC5015]|nr:glycine cleavage system T protein [gamma proteobacterium HTCC5015]